MAVSSEVRQLCDEVQRFVREQVDPRSREIEESDAVPDDLVGMARDMGLFGLTIPEEYGGSGLDLAGKCAIEEVMGQTNYGFATLIGNHTGISTTGITALGNDAQKKKFLPKMASGEWIGSFALTEPQAGSDPAAMRTTAVKKGDRYVLNGEKIYITNAGLAQVFTVMAITDKARGIKGISAFIVERGMKGFSIGRNELKMGMHGCTTAPLAFTDCEVPAENLLGAEGMGYVQALKTLTAGRVTVSARCCGMMDKLITQTADYMKTRTQGGKKLAEHQGLQWMLADMAVARDAARGLTQRAIETLMKGERGTMEASTAKLFATEALGRVVDAAVQIHGGMGYMREMGIETTYRDARIVRIYEGTSEIQRNIIAGLLLQDA
ncbi:MAG: acyl-CoA dehydrogenase family protein [Betaproteobacteria bacterium]|jgi:acyl-CoA dehydrogenase|nr:acyl-CoA dehydrogenase family protein [Betaproteobacteria bacterium]MDH4292789.1 acyl-CoA dehydrogenase family protein [Betaproteobacteria bacterium]MDH5341451.1 acyl-CoA dehydrogenase family protein [Betaproteobacteria bacterium]